MKVKCSKCNNIFDFSKSMHKAHSEIYGEYYCDDCIDKYIDNIFENMINNSIDGLHISETDFINDLFLSEE